MTTDTASLLVGEGWRDRLQAGVRGRIRGSIEGLLEEELIAALGRARYARSSAWRARQAHRPPANRMPRM